MADDKPETVTVEALKYHTYNGKEYQVGDTYEYPAEYAEGLAANGFAVRVDRVAVAKAAAKADAKAVAARAATPSKKASAKASKASRKRGK